MASSSSVIMMAAESAPDHDNTVADLGIILILAAGVINGPIYKIAKTIATGQANPNLHIDLFAVFGEVVFVMILSIISEHSWSARRFSLAILWALFFVLIVMNSIDFAKIMGTYQGKVSGTQSTGTASTKTATGPQGSF